MAPPGASSRVRKPASKTWLLAIFTMMAALVQLPAAQAQTQVCNQLGNVQGFSHVDQDSVHYSAMAYCSACQAMAMGTSDLLLEKAYVELFDISDEAPASKYTLTLQQSNIQVSGNFAGITGKITALHLEYYDNAEMCLMMVLQTKQSGELLIGQIRDASPTAAKQIHTIDFDLIADQDPLNFIFAENSVHQTTYFVTKTESGDWNGLYMEKTLNGNTDSYFSNWRWTLPDPGDTVLAASRNTGISGNSDLLYNLMWCSDSSSTGRSLYLHTIDSGGDGALYVDLSISSSSASSAVMTTTDTGSRNQIAVALLNDPGQIVAVLVDMARSISTDAVSSAYKYKFTGSDLSLKGVQRHDDTYYFLVVSQQQDGLLLSLDSETFSSYECQHFVGELRGSTIIDMFGAHLLHDMQYNRIALWDDNYFALIDSSELDDTQCFSFELSESVTCQEISPDPLTLTQSTSASLPGVSFQEMYQKDKVSSTRQVLDGYKTVVANPQSALLVNPCGIRAPIIESPQTMLDSSLGLVLQNAVPLSSMDNFCPNDAEPLQSWKKFDVIELTGPQGSMTVDSLLDTVTNPGQITLQPSSDWAQGDYELTYRVGYASSSVSLYFDDYSLEEVLNFQVIQCAFDSSTDLTGPDPLSSPEFLINDLEVWQANFVFTGAASFCDLYTTTVEEYTGNAGALMDPQAGFTYDHDSQTLTLERTATQTSVFYFKYVITSLIDQSVSLTSWHQVTATYCPWDHSDWTRADFVIPAFLDTQRVIPWSKDQLNGVCDRTMSLSYAGGPIDESKFTFQYDETYGRYELTIETMDPNIVGVYDQFVLTVTSAFNSNIYSTYPFTLSVLTDLCTAFTHPTTFETIGTELIYDTNVTTEVVTFYFIDASNDPCSFTSTVTGVEGYAFLAVLVNESDQVTALEIDLAAVEEPLELVLTYSMASTYVFQEEPNSWEQQFTVKIINSFVSEIKQPEEQDPPIFNSLPVLSDCEPNLIVGLDLASISPVTYRVGEEALYVSLEGISNGNCGFLIALEDSQSALAADSDVFELVQPVFSEEETATGLAIELQEPAHLIIHTLDSAKTDSYELILFIDGTQSETVTLNLAVEIVSCTSVTEDSEESQEVSLVVGDEDQELVIQSLNPSCLSSVLSVTLSDKTAVMPDFIRAQVDEIGAILTISGFGYSDIGQYQLEVVEEETITGAKAVTHLSVSITAPASGQDDLTESVSRFTQEIIKELLEAAAEGSGVDLTEFERSDEDKSDQLVAYIYDFSPTGNLTITFNKQIIIPLLEIRNLTAELGQAQDEPSPLTSDRRLQTQEQLLACLQRPLPVECVLNITVAHANDAEDIENQVKVDEYYLTRLTPQSMDIQVVFNYPEQLGLERLNPDRLSVDFSEGQIFMSTKGFVSMPDDFQIEVDVPPQISLEEWEQIQILEEQLAQGMAALTIGQLALNIVLAFGLKYLWNMVNLLQFIIFMRLWYVSIPLKTETWLKSLKSLALFEFLPTDKIDDWLFERLGIDQEPAQTKDAETSEFDKMAVVIMGGVAILLACLLILLFVALKRACPKVQSCYLGLKRKIFYNSMLRYLLLGTLKIQINLGTGLAAGKLIAETADQPKMTGSSLYINLGLVIFMQLSPVLIGCILYRNRKQLSKPDVQQKIGALYFGFLPEQPYVGTYNVMFLVRRNLFVILTFFMLRHPAFQVEFMIYMTLIFMCYISQMRFHESTAQRRIELYNESLLLILCYHFIAFADLGHAWGTDFKKSVGESLVKAVFVLLGSNTLIIIGVSVLGIKRKCRLRMTKKRNIKKRKEYLVSCERARNLGQVELKARNVQDVDPDGLISVKANSNALLRGAYGAHNIGMASNQLGREPFQRSDLIEQGNGLDLPPMQRDQLWPWQQPFQINAIKDPQLQSKARSDVSSLQDMVADLSAAHKVASISSYVSSEELEISQLHLDPMGGARGHHYQPSLDPYSNPSYNSISNINSNLDPYSNPGYNSNPNPNPNRSYNSISNINSNLDPYSNPGYNPNPNRSYNSNPNLDSNLDSNLDPYPYPNRSHNNNSNFNSNLNAFISPSQPEQNQPVHDRLLYPGPQQANNEALGATTAQPHLLLNSHVNQQDDLQQQMVQDSEIIRNETKEFDSISAMILDGKSVHALAPEVVQQKLRQEDQTKAEKAEADRKAKQSLLVIRPGRMNALKKPSNF